MKEFFRRILGFVPHASIVLAVMMITFTITDRYNRPMAFINNDITKALLLVLSVLAIVESVYLIAHFRRQQAEAYRQAEEKKTDKKQS